jgi:hypothetical protein
LIHRRATSLEKLAKEVTSRRRHRREDEKALGKVTLVSVGAKGGPRVRTSVEQRKKERRDSHGKTLDKTIYTSLLFFVFGLTACSTNKETTPMEAPQAVMAPPTKSNPDVRKTQANTSLDSLKRGEALVTPRGDH